VTDYTEAAFVASLKTNDPAGPWLVVRGNTPEELISNLTAVGTHGLAGVVAAAAANVGAEWVAEKQGAAQATTAAVQQVQQAVAPQQPQNVVPFPQQQQQQGNVAGGSETDRWGNTYTYGHPQAPSTAHGPAVLKSGTSREGKAYQQWLDPRDPKIPSVYQKNGKDKPFDLWSGEFVKGRV
jgi:hypothetical protein